MQTIFIEKIVDFHPEINTYKYLFPHLTLRHLDHVFDCADKIDTLEISDEEKADILSIKENMNLLMALKTKLEEINEKYFLSDGFAFFYVPQNGVNDTQKSYNVRNRIWLDQSEFESFSSENKALIDEVYQLKNQIKNTIPFYSTWQLFKVETKTFEVENLNFSESEEICNFCGTV